RGPQRHLSLLPGAPAGRRGGAGRHVPDGAERVADLPRGPGRRRRPAGAGARSFPVNRRRGPGPRRRPGMSQNKNAHEKVEKNVGLLAVLIAVAVSFGGLAEIVPLMYQAEAIEPLPGVEPYPALELAGRDV